MPAGDARPVPRKNVPFRLYFAVRNSATSQLITSWTGADSEVSLDGGSFADCTNEATEIGTSGCGFIDFTASEMNADAVVYKLTLTNSNAVQLVLVLFPEEAGDYRGEATTVSDKTGYTVSTVSDKTGYSLASGGLASVTAWTVAITGNITGNLSGSVGSVTNRVTANTDQLAGQTVTAAAGVTFPTSLASPTNITAGTITTVSGNVNGSVGSVAANGITASSIASGAFDDKGNWLKPTVAGRTLDVTATGAAGIDWGNIENQSAGNNFLNSSIVAASVETPIQVGSFDPGAITAAAFATDSITSTALAASFVNEIRDGVWDATLSSYTTAGSAGLALSDLVSRVTSTVKGMWDNLVAMITGSGASAKYTVTALSNAPSGGGGGGGDPWATDIATGYTGTQAGAILNNINSKAELITSETVYLSSDASNGTNITVYKDEVRTVTVPVDENLTTKTLRFVVEDFQGADVFTVADASITKTSTTFSFATTSALTGEVAEYDWSLRDITSGINRIVSKGVLSVKPAAELDA